MTRWQACVRSEAVPQLRWKGRSWLLGRKWHVFHPRQYENIPPFREGGRKSLMFSIAFLTDLGFLKHLLIHSILHYRRPLWMHVGLRHAQDWRDFEMAGEDVWRVHLLWQQGPDAVCMVFNPLVSNLIVRTERGDRVKAWWKNTYMTHPYLLYI